MIGNNSFEIEGQGPGDTGTHQFGTAVEDRRRGMGDASIACEQIRSEQELEIMAIKTGVSVRMSWQMYGGEAVPNGNL